MRYQGSLMAFLAMVSTAAFQLLCSSISFPNTYALVNVRTFVGDGGESDSPYPQRRD